MMWANGKAIIGPMLKIFTSFILWIEWAAAWQQNLHRARICYAYNVLILSFMQLICIHQCNIQAVHLFFIRMFDRYCFGGLQHLYLMHQNEVPRRIVLCDWGSSWWEWDRHSTATHARTRFSFSIGGAITQLSIQLTFRFYSLRWTSKKKVKSISASITPCNL